MMVFGAGGATKKTPTKEVAKKNQERSSTGFGKMWQHPFSINHSSSKEGKKKATKDTSSTKPLGFFSRSSSSSSKKKNKTEDVVERGGTGFWNHPFVSSPKLGGKADNGKSIEGEGRQHHWPSLFTSSNNDSRSNDGRGRVVADTTKTISSFSLDEVQDGKVDMDTASIATTSQDTTGGKQNTIPERLVDYFIVVGTDLQEQLPKLEQANNGDEKRRVASSLSLPSFEPQVLDRIPKPNQSWDDMEFPNQVSLFCFPNGYNTSKIQHEPTICTFVLTAETGHRIHGSVATMYEPVYINEIYQIYHNNQLPTPSWLPSLDEDKTGHRELENRHSEKIRKADDISSKKTIAFYLPKCLVVISHHPYYEVQTKFLHQLLHLQKSKKSPLPLERYIANFVNDIPLPRNAKNSGKQEVVYWNGLFKSQSKDGVDSKADRITIARPAPNQLPLANFSYRPLFRCLSVSNILVLWSVLLQEGKVVLLSQHRALLTPVVEALLSLLFPLTWQGIYIPLLPSHMLEVLVDAPLPFLVGITNLTTGYQPEGVVICDLDQDVVKLGFDDMTGQPRLPPVLPPILISRLKVELEEAADPLYLIPPCGIKGRITNGVDDQQIVENAFREPYCQMSRLREASLDNDHRQFIFTQAETLTLPAASADELVVGGYVIGGEEISRKPSNASHTSSKAQLSSKGKQQKPRETDMSIMMNSLKRQSRAVQSHADQVLSITGLNEGYATPSPYAKVYRDDEMEQKKHEMARTLYEIDNELAHKVRHNFLRFFSALFMRYKQFEISDKHGGGTDVVGGDGHVSSGSGFRHASFIKTLNIASNSRPWVENIVRSQMFERFLHESTIRRKFFDEHVILEQNESSLFKKKQPTPFLDKVWTIENVIIPAGPCDVGIRKGRVFTYETFPKLDEEELVSSDSLDPTDAFFRSFGCSSLWCFSW